MVSARSYLDAQTTLVITPVDMLPVSPATLASLIAAITPEIHAATPTHHGRGGHPVVIRSHLLALPGDSLRDRLTNAGAARARVTVDDASILTDLDTPADVAAIA